MVAHHARDVSLSAMESGGGYNRNKITEESTGREVKSQLRGYKTSDDEKGDSRRRVKWLDQKSPLVKVFRLIHHEMTLWDRAGPTLKCVNGNRTRMPEGSDEIPMSKDGRRIVLNTNNCYQIGQDRAIRYMHLNNVETPYKVERSEKESEGGVNLGRLLATTTDREEELDRLKTRGTSVNEKELAAVFIVKELEVEIAKLVLLLKSHPFGLDVEDVPSKALKEEKVKKLVELRSIYFGQDIDARKRIESDIVDSFNNQYPESSIDEEAAAFDLKHDWWSLSKDVLDTERFSSCTK